MEENKEFGQYLKKLRKIKGITLTELGEMVGYSNPYLSQIETGKRGTPSPEILAKLSGPLGVSYEELMIEAGYILPSGKIGYTLSGGSIVQFVSDELGPDDPVFTDGEWVIPSEDTKRKRIEDFLERKGTTYKGQALTDSDRRLIAAFVEGLFAERLNKGE